MLLVSWQSAQPSWLWLSWRWLFWSLQQSTVCIVYFFRSWNFLYYLSIFVSWSACIHLSICLLPLSVCLIISYSLPSWLLSVYFPVRFSVCSVYHCLEKDSSKAMHTVYVYINAYQWISVSLKYCNVKRCDLMWSNGNCSRGTMHFLGYNRNVHLRTHMHRSGNSMYNFASLVVGR